MNHQTNISNSNKSYLLSKGFVHVGLWKNGVKGLDFSLDKKWAKLPGLYVFLDSNDQVLYIGRTTGELQQTLHYFQYGFEGQVTNHRIHNDLLKQLEKPLSVEIFAYTNANPRTDLAAYFDEIKAELIQHANPLWNLR